MIARNRNGVAFGERALPLEHATRDHDTKVDVVVSAEPATYCDTVRNRAPAATEHEAKVAPLNNLPSEPGVQVTIPQSLLDTIAQGAAVFRHNTGAAALAIVMGHTPGVPMPVESYAYYMVELWRECGSPSDPIAQQMIEQLAVIHFSYLANLSRASQQTDLEAIQIFHEIARQFKAEHRRTALALRQYVKLLDKNDAVNQRPETQPNNAVEETVGPDVRGQVQESAPKLQLRSPKLAKREMPPEKSPRTELGSKATAKRTKKAELNVNVPRFTVPESSSRRRRAKKSR